MGYANAAAAYGFGYNSLQILQSHLSNKKQRTKINVAYSTYCEISFRVTQASIIDPLLFNIYYVMGFMTITIVIWQVMPMIIPFTQVAAIETQ